MLMIFISTCSKVLICENLSNLWQTLEAKKKESATDYTNFHRFKAA